MIHIHVTITKADCNDVILLEVLENIDKIHTHFEFNTCDQIHCNILLMEKLVFVMKMDVEKVQSRILDLYQSYELN